MWLKTIYWDAEDWFDAWLLSNVQNLRSKQHTLAKCAVAVFMAVVIIYFAAVISC